MRIAVIGGGPGGLYFAYLWKSRHPDADVDLIRDWITAGAEGAQCLANADGRGCLVETEGSNTIYSVVECVDGTAARVVQTCAANEVCALSTGNGTCVRI